MVQRFKQMTMAGAVALALTAPAAWAATGVQFDPDGNLAAFGTHIVTQFDWGTGHVLYSNCFGLGGLGAASACTIRAQGHIINGGGGGLTGAPTPPNVAYTFELQTGATSTSGPGTYDGTGPNPGESLTFINNPADYATSFFRIYADDAPAGNPDFLAGTGYNAVGATLILEGRVTVVDYSLTNVGTTPVLFDQANGGDNWGGLKTHGTSGSPTFTIDVTFVETAYFKDPLASFTLNLTPDADHADNSTTPFKQINPAKSVVGTPFSAADTGLDGIVDIYCGSKSVLVSCSGEFQGDASTVFLLAVPEPGMLALLGIGFAGLAAFTRRRREAVTA